MNGGCAISFIIAAVSLLLIISFVTDIKSQVIPNRLTIPFFAAGLLFHIVKDGISGGLWALAGAAAGFFPLLLLYIFKGIGAGDVKLFGAIGAWAGVWAVLQMMFYSLLYAGLIGVFLIIANRKFARNVAAGLVAIFIPAAGAWKRQGWLQWARSGKGFPFMLAVAPAAITVWVLFYSHG